MEEIFLCPRILSRIQNVFNGCRSKSQPMEHAMKLTVVRYKTKPETADQNERLILSGIAHEVPR